MAHPASPLSSRFGRSRTARCWAAGQLRPLVKRLTQAQQAHRQRRMADRQQFWQTPQAKDVMPHLGPEDRKTLLSWWGL
jgi:hypothetical protein